MGEPFVDVAPASMGCVADGTYWQRKLTPWGATVFLTELAKISPLGLRDTSALTDSIAPAGFLREARDGSIFRWGETGMPGPPQIVPPGIAPPVTVAVSPTRPGHTVIVEYRVNGGPVRQAIAVPEPPIPNVHGRLFRAVLPAQSGGVVEYLPVLRFAGQPISPRLGELAETSRYQVGGGALPLEAAQPLATPSAESVAKPRWDWAGKFLGSCTIFLRKEVVGSMSDGLRVDWHFKEAHFVGPHLEGDFLPGAADWMRVRPDGVALVQVIGCLQTTTGARVFCSYGGIVDLGADGYARALRGEFDPLPAFIGAPTYQTADKELEWLNRAQCLCVGRVDMKALRVEYDVYVIEVGGRKDSRA
jgi:hypothetical protein